MRVLSKYKDIIKALAIYPLVYVIAFIIYIIINLVYKFLMWVLCGDLYHNIDIFSNSAEYYTLLVNCITIFIYYNWYKRLKKDAQVSYKRKITYYDKISLILCGIGSKLMIYGVMNLLLKVLMEYSPVLIKEYNNMKYLSGTVPIISIVNSVITAPLSEELVFRGVLLRKSEKVMPFFAANILQSLLFGLFHMNLVMFIYTFPIGLLFGYITSRYKTILPSIYIHSLHNAFEILILITLKDQEVINIPRVLWVLITIIGACLISQFIYNTRGKKQELQDPSN